MSIQAIPSHQKQAGSMPHCRRCKSRATPDKPLFRCSICRRSYHSACHRPLPRNPINWTCKSCSDQSQTKKHHYHENSALPSSSSSRAVLRVSSSTASRHERSREAASIMAHSQSSTQPSCLVGSEQNEQSDSESTFLQSCPWPECTAQINVKEDAMCPEHTLFLVKGNSHPQASAAPEPRATSLPTVAVNLASDSNPNPKKTLKQQTMRKTASSDAPRSDVQPALNLKNSSLPPLPSKTKGSTSSLSPNQNITPNTGTPTTMASAPSQFAPTPPPTYSPPISPASLKDMEPPKKQQKVSPVLLQSNESRLNGNGVPTNPLSTQRSPEKRPDKERKTSLKQSKPSARQPVRKMAPMKHLRFTDEPNNDVPSPSINGITPVSTTNGPAESTSDLRPPSCSISLNWEQGGHIDKMEVDSAPPTRPILASQQETLEIFSAAHSAAPNFHPPRADYFAQETHLSINRVDGPSKSPPVCLPEIERSTPGGVSTTPKAKRPKKLVITTKLPRSAKVTRPVTPTDLDYPIYSQPGASTPPPGLEIPGLKKPPPASASAPSSAVSQQPPLKQEPQKDEPLALDIDPRIHYPQSRSLAWYAMKVQDIEARGTRKQRFGKAAQSLKKQMEAQAEANVPWEETLPEKIQENSAWVRALKGLRGISPTPSAAAAEETTEERGDVMDFTMNNGGNGASSVNGSSAVPNGGVLPANGAVERKARKIKRTGSGLSVVSRDGKLSFEERNGNHQQGTAADGAGSVNGSFGGNGYGMN